MFIMCLYILSSVPCCDVTRSNGKSSHCLWQGELKMDNPEKLATQGTKDEEKNMATTGNSCF
jgi:hypothetical protein